MDVVMDNDFRPCIVCRDRSIIFADYRNIDKNSFSRIFGRIDHIGVCGKLSLIF